MQHTFLGLTHNPFVPPHEGFFAGGDRKTHLDHLRHLSQWSRRVLAVTGPYGMGKTTLYRQLSNNLEAKTKGARLSGSVVNSEREVLVGLLQGFGVGAHNEAHVDDIVSLIVQHVNDQDGLGRTCIAMIDDAHRLDAIALRRLLDVVAGSALRVVLFAEAEVIAAISPPAQQLELDWFEIRLTGLPRGDVREYLEWRFAQAQYRGRLPFTEAQVESIVSRSSGNPHAVNQLASQMLGELESGEVRKRSSKFPLMHMALTVCLIAIIGLAYILVQPPEEEASGSAVEPVVVDLDPAVANNASQAIQQTASNDEQDTIEALEGPLNPERGQQHEDAKDVEGADADEAVAEAASIAAAAVNQVTPEQVDQAGRDSRDEVARVQQAPTISPTASDADRITEAEPVQPVVDTVAAPAPAVAASVSPVPVEESNAGHKGVGWLLKQDASRYTLQLVTVSSQQRATALIDKQDAKSEFALVPTRRGDKTLYVIIYGLFTSQAAANTAQPILRGELAGLKPWVRPIGQLQRAAYKGT